MSDFSDPTGCQAAAGWQPLDYIADQADGRRRLKRGQVQSLCSVCERWRWKDRQCKNFVKFPSQQEVVQIILASSTGVGFADISRLTGYTKERIRQLYKKHNKTGKGIRQIQPELKAKNNKENKQMTQKQAQQVRLGQYPEFHTFLDFLSQLPEDEHEQAWIDAYNRLLPKVGPNAS